MRNNVHFQLEQSATESKKVEHVSRSIVGLYKFAIGWAYVRHLCSIDVSLPLFEFRLKPPLVLLRIELGLLSAIGVERVPPEVVYVVNRKCECGIAQSASEWERVCA